MSPLPPTSQLYRRILLLRIVLPLLVIVISVAADLIFGDGALIGRETSVSVRTVAEHATYFLGAAILVAGALTWLAQRVRERDEAAAFVQSLYNTSHELMSASTVEQVVEIALRMAGQIIAPSAASIMLEEDTGGAWTIAGVHNLSAEQQAVLQTTATTTDVHLSCLASHTPVARDHDCQMLSALQASMQPAPVSVTCLALSDEQPARAILSVYLFTDEELPETTSKALESLAAGAAVALDRARLRARELRMLQQMHEAVRWRQDLAGTLQLFLSGLATAYQADAGAIFLDLPDNPEAGLNRIAAWPTEDIPAELTAAASRLAQAEPAAPGEQAEQHEGIIAVPLSTEGQCLGAIVLTGQQSALALQAPFLRIAADMVTLFVRNNQLYTELETRAVLDERQRLAREMHDGLSQSLGFLNLRLQQAVRLQAKGDGPAAGAALDDARQLVQELYRDARLTIENLRWDAQPDQTLAESLEEYGKTFAQSTGLEVTVHASSKQRLPAQAKVHLLRITQEALANVYRHARARRAQVSLEDAAEGLVLTVEDDGVGIVEPSVETAGHFGLQVIRERAALVNGDVSIQGVPHQGTRLQIRIPAATRPPNGHDPARL